MNMIRNPPLADGQPAYTTSVKKNSGSRFKDLEKTFADDEKNFLKLVMETAKRPSLNPDHQDLTPMIMSGFKAASATIKQAQIAAEAAKIQEESSKYQKAAVMTGQKIRIDNSIKGFDPRSTDKVKYEFDLLSKNLPKNAAINAHIIIRKKAEDGKLGKKIRSENLQYLKTGKNIFSWDGRNDLKELVESGDYKIEVRASYTIPGKSDTKIPISINISSEDVIKQVNMDGSYILESGKKIDDEAQIVSLIHTEAAQSTSEKQKPGLSETNPHSLIGKTVSVKEGKFEFDGSRVKLGFTSSTEDKNAKVKLIVRNKKGLVAIDEKEMPLYEGRNTFEWVGSSTKTDQDLQEKGSGKGFPQVPNGEYEYSVRIYYNGNQESEIAGQENTIYVQSIEQNGMETNIVSDMGETFPISLVTSVSETKAVEKAPSIDVAQLRRDAASYIGKNVRTYSTFKLDGNPVPWRFRITMPNGHTHNGPIELTIRNKADPEKIVKTLRIGQDDVNRALSALALDPSKMDETSKTALNAWVAQELGEESYEQVGDDKIYQMQEHLMDAVFRAQYKYEANCEVRASWNGQDEVGSFAPYGDYYADISSHDIVTANDSIAETLSMNPISQIVQSRVKDDKIELELSDGSKIDLGDVQAWVS